ncbi:hypothetical protein SISNIDRAFT_466738 [Sistotremastrum niveocremeum HHB9708]|uniref:Uncharacterized protein n=1 Tax=Sistotremastrum niveocremeum HHB9708 TaxID=1314777 RepID=A0A164TFH7_9AGAM|nr:hypothetical protein SISNIDRAFT_466738 [Sistotremastrum niveocremeum HHB9708]
MPSALASSIAQPSPVPVAQIAESQQQSQRPQRVRRAPARLQDYIPLGLADSLHRFPMAMSRPRSRSRILKPSLSRRDYVYSFVGGRLFPIALRSPMNIDGNLHTSRTCIFLLRTPLPHVFTIAIAIAACDGEPASTLEQRLNNALKPFPKYSIFLIARHHGLDGGTNASNRGVLKLVKEVLHDPNFNGHDVPANLYRLRQRVIAFSLDQFSSSDGRRSGSVIIFIPLGKPKKKEAHFHWLSTM